MFHIYLKEINHAPWIKIDEYENEVESVKI